MVEVILIYVEQPRALNRPGAVVLLIPNQAGAELTYDSALKYRFAAGLNINIKAATTAII